jgi:hypothetical protein
MQRTLLLPLAAAALVTASAPPRTATMKWGQCFQCENTAPGSGVHEDFSLFFNNLEGEMHGEQIGSCSEWIGPGGHIPYQQSPSAVDLAAVMGTAEGGSDAMLLKLIGESSQVRLNTTRNALQVFATDDIVVLHYPLDQAQTERLAAALQQ